MIVLLIGVGAVGEAIARMSQSQKWMKKMILAGHNVQRAQEVQEKLAAPLNERFPIEFLDASDQKNIEFLAQKYNVDLIINSVAPIFNKQIFDAAFNVGVNYIDMAMSLSEQHPTDPYNKIGIKLGDYQFEKALEWEKKQILAIVGLGVEPGVADIFARYAADYLFDEIEEIGVRDATNITIEGHRFAPTFSIWSTLEECLNPPVIWENGSWYTTEPFSEPEIFDFPEIGPFEVVNVEHEEVILIPRWINTKRVTFKYGLDKDFINVLKTLHMLGLNRKEKILVNQIEISPRDVVVACLPRPSDLGDKMEGKTCAGTWIKGLKEGKTKEVYIYQIADNQECLDKWGCHAIAAQTAFSVVIAMDLIQNKQWLGSGVLGPEAFESRVFMEKMAQYGFPYAIKDM